MDLEIHIDQLRAYQLNLNLFYQQSLEESLKNPSNNPPQQFAPKRTNPEPSPPKPAETVNNGVGIPSQTAAADNRSLFNKFGL